MKTLTLILYFVAILSLIEANWRVKDHYGFSSADQSKFLRYARSAMSQRGRSYGDKMEFLWGKMENYYGGSWHCFYGTFAAMFRSVRHITIREGNTENEIMCFHTYVS